MKGFTLVEMLVALLVFSLLSAAGVAVLGSAADNRAVVRERMDEIAALQSARALIKTDLEQAADRRTRADGGAPGRSLSGGESDAAPVLAFTRRGWDNPDAAPRASLQYVEYRLVEDRLERRARPALDGAALGEPQVLLRGVRSLNVAFYARGSWAPAWAPTADRALPQAIRLDMSLEDFGEVTQLVLLPDGGA
ncbi:MAG: type II secretion system minor pseudopilin GspJ [Phenylobacterium sp.]|nr:type II secretion system minor pseudopilin GspJ [Phenylobacterium sp.]